MDRVLFFQSATGSGETREGLCDFVFGIVTICFFYTDEDGVLCLVSNKVSFSLKFVTYEKANYVVCLVWIQVYGKIFCLGMSN